MAALAADKFPIGRVLGKIEKAIAAFPKAMLFELRDRGHRSTFEQLTACMISIRTLDEVSLQSALRLFRRASTPGKMRNLSVDEIDGLIRPATFHRQKAARILQIAETAEEKYHGKLPAEEEVLLDLPGVGPKCAHLTLGVAHGQEWIGVDIHVHRVTNRWGFVRASTPEKTEAQLRAILPRKDWVRINELLVPFGKHICTGRRPFCSKCPVFVECARVGVHEYR